MKISVSVSAKILAGRIYCFGIGIGWTHICLTLLGFPYFNWVCCFFCFLFVSMTINVWLLSRPSSILDWFQKITILIKWNLLFLTLFSFHCPFLAQTYTCLQSLLVSSSFFLYKTQRSSVCVCVSFKIPSVWSCVYLQKH